MDIFPDIELPDWGLEVDTEADIDEVVLGDGYVVRRPKGLNHLKDSWSPTWSGLEVAVARSTHAWLRERLNRTPFKWTHPVSGLEVQVICKSVKLTYNQFNDEILNATFTQDFNPA